MQILHMNKGERGGGSYAKNSSVQRQIISLGNPMIEEAVAEALQNTLPHSMGIADLGCSSGPNALMPISHIINSLCHASYHMGIPLPELRLCLNDLPPNDFNQLFTSLPELYATLSRDNGIGRDRCFISAVPASFYGRLFPPNTMHLLHSSSSLHWLSRVPPLDVAPNTGKIYISKTSPDSVVNAYLSQFDKDWGLFLRCRAAEMVAGGKMVLSFMGRTSPDASAEVGTHQWELLAQALTTMAKQGDVEEEKIDSFNVPYYAPSPEEVRKVIEEEGSFIINRLEAFEIGWDGGPVGESGVRKHEFEPQEWCRAKQVAKTIRAVVEPMLEVQFGKQIMDELFDRYAQLVQHYFSKTVAKHINLLISVTRK